MKICETGCELVDIYDILRQLGVAADSTMFFYTAYAIHVAAQQPQKLTYITKWLYPEVARRYHTTWQAVERGIRYEICLIWKKNSRMLSSMAGASLKERPTPKQFIAILIAWIAREAA